MTEGVLTLIVLAAAIIQIAMIVTFFSMNSKLGMIQMYLRKMAEKEGAVEVGKTPVYDRSSKTPWICPKCQHNNVYWVSTCAKCGTSR